MPQVVPSSRRGRLLTAAIVVALVVLAAGVWALNEDDRESGSPTTATTATTTTNSVTTTTNPGELVPTADSEVRSWDERDLSDEPEMATATNGYLSSTAHVALPEIDDPTSVTQARLTLSVIDGGPVAVSSSAPLDEEELRWANRPTVLNAVEAANATAGQRLELDVTTEVRAGHHTFTLRAPGDDRVVVAASEHSSRPGPTLRLERGEVHEMPTELVAEIARPSCDPSMPDSTAAMQRWLSTVPDSAVARLPAKQCIRSELPLFIERREALTIDGNGTTLAAFTNGCDSQTDDDNPFDACRLAPPRDELRFQWPQARPMIRVEHSTDVVFHELIIDGGATTVGELVTLSAFQHAWSIDGDNDGIVLDHVRADRVAGDYVYLRDSDNSTVQQSTFGQDHGEASGNGRQGIAVTSGTNVYLRHNNIAGVTRSIIDIEANDDDDHLRNIVVEHNLFLGEGSLGWFANRGADSLHDGIYVRYNTIHGVGAGGQIRAPGMPLPDQLRRRNYQIVGNVGTLPSASARHMLFWIHGIDGIRIEGHEAIDAGESDLALIEATNSRNIRLIGNTLRNGVEAGRYPDGVDSVCERDNQVGDPLRPDPTPVTTGC